MTITNANMRSDEFQAVAMIVGAALDAGHAVSVYDGEAYAIRFSTDRAAILSACGSTEADKLIIRTALGERVGSVTLVYGNEPGVLIADHTDNEAMAALLERARAGPALVVRALAVARCRPLSLAGSAPMQVHTNAQTNTAIARVLAEIDGLIAWAEDDASHATAHGARGAAAQDHNRIARLLKAKKLVADCLVEE